MYFSKVVLSLVENTLSFKILKPGKIAGQIRKLYFVNATEHDGNEMVESVQYTEYLLRSLASITIAFPSLRLHSPGHSTPQGRPILSVFMMIFNVWIERL